MLIAAKKDVAASAVKVDLLFITEFDFSYNRSVSDTHCRRYERATRKTWPPHVHFTFFNDAANDITLNRTRQPKNDVSPEFSFPEICHAANAPPVPKIKDFIIPMITPP